LITFRVAFLRSIITRTLSLGRAQLDARDCAFVNSPHPHVGAIGPNGDGLKVRIQTIGGAEQELLAADPKHTRGKNEQRRNDKGAKSKSFWT